MTEQLEKFNPPKTQKNNFTVLLAKLQQTEPEQVRTEEESYKTYNKSKGKVMKCSPRVCNSFQA